MARKWLPAGLVIVLAALGTIAVRVNRPKSRVAPTEPAPIASAAAPAAPAIVEITLAGRVQAANVVNVTSPVDGTIEQLMAGAGDTVIEGRILARVSNPKLAADRAMAEMELERRSNRIAQLDSAVIAARLEISRSEGDASRSRLELQRAEKEYQRQQLMFREGITPRVVYEKSQQDYNALKTDSEQLAEAAKNAVNRAGDLSAELASARRDLEQQKAALEQSRVQSAAGDVLSPAEGIIVGNCCQAGDTVTASTTLFQISSDLTKLEVTALADSATAARLHPGQPAIVEIANVPGVIAGRVREIDAGQVVVEFTSAFSAVRPGMMARVKIKVS